MWFVFFFQAEDGIRDAQESRGLGDVYKRQINAEYGGADQRIEAHHDLPTLKVTLSLCPLDDTHVGFQVGDMGGDQTESPTTSRSASRRVGSSSVDARVAERASRDGLTRAYADLSGQHERVAGTPFIGGRDVPEGVYELPEGAAGGATPLKVVAVGKLDKRDSSHLKPPGGSLFDRLKENT
eukprot:TRINITY_DN27225_c0_g1_i1.p1 TRINITY_DN27225_c0_g1~~TRINITY_DN27225_c0_g1_i1.p1  ORF type:complete len:182 (-),score=47.22 TRINITY_DN27225_c0_g1_i1:145-690(-)